jgi:hypothetical protein
MNLIIDLEELNHARVVEVWVHGSSLSSLWPASFAVVHLHGLWSLPLVSFLSFSFLGAFFLL